MDWDVFVQNRYQSPQVRVIGALVQGPHGLWIERQGNSWSLCESCHQNFLDALEPPPPCKGCGK